VLNTATTLVSGEREEQHYADGSDEDEGPLVSARPSRTWRTADRSSLIWVSIYASLVVDTDVPNDAQQEATASMSATMPSRTPVAFAFGALVNHIFV
jgi:hypothetical protein